MCANVLPRTAPPAPATIPVAVPAILLPEPTGTAKAEAKREKTMKMANFILIFLEFLPLCLNFTK